MDVKTHRLYSDKLDIRILDLTKADDAIENHEDPRIIKWAQLFKAKTFKQLEELAGDEEVLKEMVFTIKELSEDERISQGIPLGRRELIQNALKNGMSPEDVSKMLCVTSEEVSKAQEEILIEKASW